MLSRYLNKEAVAALFDVSTRTIDRWVTSKAIPDPVKIGGRLYWLERDLQHWQDQQRGISTAPVKVVFDCDVPPYGKGEGAAFDLPTAGKLFALQLVSLHDPSDYQRLTIHMAPVMAARRAAELAGKEFCIEIGGQWFAVPRLYYADDERGDDGEPEGAPDVPQGDGARRLTRQEIIDYFRREYSDFVEKGVRDFAPMLNQMQD